MSTHDALNPDSCSLAGGSTAVELPCSAILFDLDGVLVSSAASVRRSWLQWASDHDLDPGAVLAATPGTRSVDTIRAVAPALDAELEAAQLEQRQAEDVADIEQCSGAGDLLNDLDDDEWAIVTSAPTWLAKVRLRAAGLPEPRVLVANDDVETGKPEPDGYLLAARQLGCSTSECLVIEDAAAGVEAGRRAGMRVVGLTHGGDTDALSGADVLVETCADLVLDRHSGRGLQLTAARVIRG
ncbi:HAD-IA family hydrolase [Nocardia sp. NPDC006630]|uniref:HAD-IA family hydrolase n=1 Tax=Nocardia sp. NPDC006630 TaxID=3157181 RepID=UPI0033BF9130